MEQLHDRCCGIDVHQAELTACVRIGEGKRFAEHVQAFACWHILSTNQPYIDPGPTAARKNSEAAIRNRAVRQLRSLGYIFNLEHLQQPA